MRVSVLSLFAAAAACRKRGVCVRALFSHTRRYSSTPLAPPGCDGVSSERHSHRERYEDDEHQRDNARQRLGGAVGLESDGGLNSLNAPRRKATLAVGVRGVDWGVRKIREVEEKTRAAR